MDSWRILHTSGRNFSYYLKVQFTYTRIDLLCVDHFTLESLQLASIENIIISGHTLITVTLSLLEGTHRTWSWRLNENVLDDTAVISKTMEVLTHYFRENTSDSLSEGIVWETHRAVVRGKLIF